MDYYELAMSVLKTIAIVSALIASFGYLRKGQYHEAWWFLGLTLMIMVSP